MSLTLRKISANTDFSIIWKDVFAGTLLDVAETHIQIVHYDGHIEVEDLAPTLMTKIDTGHFVFNIVLDAGTYIDEKMYFVRYITTNPYTLAQEMIEESFKAYSDASVLVRSGFRVGSTRDFSVLWLDVNTGQPKDMENATISVFKYVPEEVAVINRKPLHRIGIGHYIYNLYIDPSLFEVDKTYFVRLYGTDADTGVEDVQEETLWVVSNVGSSVPSGLIITFAA